MLKRIVYSLFLLLPAGYSLFRIISIQHLSWLYLACAVLAAASFVGYLLLKNFKTGIVIQFGLAFVFLDLAFNKVQWGYFDDFYRQIDFRYLAPVIITIIVNMSIRALKWRMLFPERPGLPSLFSSTFIGFMANTIFPARAGEFIRAFIVADKEHLSKSQCLTTIFLERLMDGLALMTFFILLVAASPLDRGKFLVYGILAVALYSAVLLFFILFYLRKAFFKKIILELTRRFLPRFRKSASGIIDKVHAGLELFRDLKSLVVFFLLTLLNWTVILFTIFLINKSVGLLGMFHIGGISWFYSSLFILIMICFAVAIPSGPGGAGPYQYIVQAALLIMNPAIRDSAELMSKAAGFSIYIWLIQAIPVIIMGIIFYLFSGYSIGKLKKAVR